MKVDETKNGRKKTDEHQSWKWKKQMNTHGKLLKYAEQRLQTNGHAEIDCAVAWKTVVGFLAQV